MALDIIPRVEGTGLGQLSTKCGIFVERVAQGQRQQVPGEVDDRGSGCLKK